MSTNPLPCAVRLLAALAVTIAAGCDPVGQTELVIDNRTSREILVTVNENPVGSNSTRISAGETAVVAEGSNIPDAPPPDDVASSLLVYASVDDDFVAAYSQDPLDPDAWREVESVGDCQVAECRRYVLVLRDEQLDLD